MGNLSGKEIASAYPSLLKQTVQLETPGSDGLHVIQLRSSEHFQNLGGAVAFRRL